MVSVFFIIFQIIILIDFVNAWQENWMSKDWKVPILFVSFLFYGGSLTLLVFYFIWYARAEGRDGRSAPRRQCTESEKGSRSVLPTLHPSLSTPLIRMLRCLDSFASTRRIQ